MTKAEIKKHAKLDGLRALLATWRDPSCWSREPARWLRNGVGNPGYVKTLVERVEKLAKKLEGKLE